MIKDRYVQGLEEIQEPSSYFTLEDFENLFKLWMERLPGVIASDVNYCH
jgi:hypothetical protein